MSEAGIGRGSREELAEAVIWNGFFLTSWSLQVS